MYALCAETHRPSYAHILLDLLPPTRTTTSMSLTTATGIQCRLRSKRGADTSAPKYSGCVEGPSPRNGKRQHKGSVRLGLHLAPFLLHHTESGKESSTCYVQRSASTSLFRVDFGSISAIVAGPFGGITLGSGFSTDIQKPRLLHKIIVGR